MPVEGRKGGGNITSKCGRPLDKRILAAVCGPSAALQKAQIAQPLCTAHPLATIAQ